MITLYVRTGCPFCEKTIAEAEALHVPLELKNVADEGVSDELVTRGGKLQMPYMVDSDSGVEMYESDEIIAYLHEHFRKKDAD